MCDLGEEGGGGGGRRREGKGREEEVEKKEGGREEEKGQTGKCNGSQVLQSLPLSLIYLVGKKYDVNNGGNTEFCVVEAKIVSSQKGGPVLCVPRDLRDIICRLTGG